MTEITNAKATVGAWLTYREASAYCGLGRTTLTMLVTSGAIPAAKIGKAVRISKTGLDEYMRSNAYAEAVGSSHKKAAEGSGEFMRRHTSLRRRSKERAVLRHKAGHGTKEDI